MGNQKLLQPPHAGTTRLKNHQIIMRSTSNPLFLRFTPCGAIICQSVGPMRGFSPACHCQHRITRQMNVEGGPEGCLRASEDAWSNKAQCSMGFWFCWKTEQVTWLGTWFVVFGETSLVNMAWGLGSYLQSKTMLKLMPGKLQLKLLMPPLIHLNLLMCLWSDRFKCRVIMSPN